MKKRFAVVFSGAIVISMLFSLVLVAPVSAMPPIPFSEDGGGEYAWDASVCGGFQLLEVWTVHGEGQTYLDQDGNWIKSWVKETITERITRIGNDQLELNSSTTFSGFYYYDEQRQIILARAEGNYLTFRVPVPGSGLIFHSAGKVVANYVNGSFDWRGHWDLYNGDVDALCDYFAG